MINKDALCALIPHGGEMCLLEDVIEWDEQMIVCSSISHNDKANPLRCDQGLSSVVAIEYAAQAMAVHGRLLDSSNQDRNQLSYLAAVRDVEFNTAWLHDIEVSITVKAERLIGDENGMIYQFSVYTESRLLVTGRVTVMVANE